MDQIVVTVGLNWVLQRFKERITHLAIGDNGTPSAGSETGLLNERFRKPVTDGTIIDQDIFVDTYVGNNEANFAWKEVGLFADGTAAAGSGTLIARLLWDYNHTTTAEATTVSIAITAARA